MTFRLKLTSFAALFVLGTAFSCAYSQAPGGVTATPEANDIMVAWSAVPNATYKVYSSASTPVALANVVCPAQARLTCADPNATKNATTYYVVTSIVNGVESAASAPVSAIFTGAPAPTTATTAVAAAAKPTTNVGASQTVNLQHPSLTFTGFDASMPAVAPILNADEGTLSYDKTAVPAFITSACSASYSTTSGGTATPFKSAAALSSALADPSTYVLINVINITGDKGSQSVKSTNWYIYSSGKKTINGFPGGWKLTDFDGAARFYGANKVILVSLVLNNLDGTTPAISYDFTTTKVQPSNVAGALQLLGFIMPGSAPTAGGSAPFTNYWACRQVPIAFKTSSIKVDTNYKAGAGSPFTATQTFTNEAMQYWDFSFALPVKKVSALQYNSTSNVVTANSINKEDLFVVADYYPIPTDLLASSYSFRPAIFAGVALQSQPLHSIIAGVSVGLHLVQFYAGALLIKQQQLNGIAVGGTATPGQLAAGTTYGYQPSFTIGIKLSIRSGIAAVK